MDAFNVLVGEVEVRSLCFPVVAMGLFPQRAGLVLGYPYSGCHVSWDNSPCFTIFISVCNCSSAKSPSSSCEDLFHIAEKHLTGLGTYAKLICST